MEYADNNFRRLPPDSQRLTDLARHLGAEIDCFVYEEVDSTQDLLARIPASELHNGITVVADFQSKGHGRRGRTWESAPGQGAMFSTMVEVPREQAARLPMVAGLAALDGVRSWVPQAGLKWPNDIVVPTANGLGKLGGMVIALRQEPQALWASVGIGINLDFAPGARPTLEAVAVADFASGCERDLLIARVVTSLQRRLAEAGEVARNYEANCLTIGQAVRVERPGQPALSGRAIGVTGDGALRVEAAGVIEEILAADVVHLRSN